MIPVFKKSCNLFKSVGHQISRKYAVLTTTSVNMASKTVVSQLEISNVKPQPFKYFLVLDFEATCDNNTKIVPQVKN